MNNIILVHVVHTFTDLSHEQDAVSFCEGEIICYHSFEQLPTRDAAKVTSLYLDIHSIGKHFK